MIFTQDTTFTRHEHVRALRASAWMALWVLFVTCAFDCSHAATLLWDAGGGADRSWSMVTNWTTDTEPSASDDAHVNGSYTADVSEAGEVVDNLFVGDSGTGTVVQTGGGLSADGDLTLGGNATDVGTYTISAGTLAVAGDILAGAAGQGSLSVSGTADVDARDNVRLGSANGGSGALTLSGGSLAVTNITLIGDAAGGTGTVTVSGGQLDTGGAGAGEDLIIGNAGVGSLTVSGTGVVNVNGTARDLYIAKGADSEGTLTVLGGQVNVGDKLIMAGDSGATATLTVSGGTVRIDDNETDAFRIGAADGATGTVIQTAGTIQLTTNLGDLQVGGVSGSVGSYTISGGTLDTEDDVYVGATSGAGSGLLHVIGGDATLNLGGTTSDDLTVAATGELRFSFTNDAISPLTVAGALALGGTLSISNDGAVAAGTYLLITNGGSRTGSFTTTNWLGAANGTLDYDTDSVSVTFTPHIAVLGTTNAPIADGDSTPRDEDGTRLYADLPSSMTNTFTITNDHATYTLSLTGSQYVALSGPQDEDFSVSQPAAASVAAESSRTFQIGFTPSYVGTHTATVTIASDDLRAGYDPYTFTLHGIGSYSPEPTRPASNLVFSAVSNDQMTVTWDVGDGTNRLLLARASNGISFAPTDGTMHSAQDGYSNGVAVADETFAVYNGTGVSTTVTNLRPGVTYYFELFERNGTGSGVNYLTSNVPAGIQATATYAPVITNASPVTRTISENGDPTPFALNVHATDTDARYGDVGTWALGEAPAHGTASISDTGFDEDKAVTYSPNAYYWGDDTFEIKVTDTFGNEDRVRVNVTIERRNDPGKPVFIFE